MLIVSEVPNYWGLSRNQIRYVLTMTGANGALFGGRKQRLEVSFLQQAVVEDATLVVTMNTDTIVFTAKETPVTENDVPFFDPTQTDFDAWVVDFTQKINAHSHLSVFFQVTIQPASSGYVLIFENKEEISLILDTSSFFNFTSQTAYPAETDIRPANARVRYQVFYEKQYLTSGFKAEYEGVLVPDAEGGMSLNVSDILDSLVRKNVTQEPNFIDAPYLVQNMGRFWLRFIEEYGEPVGVQSTWDSTVSLATVGGVRPNTYADFRDRMAVKGLLSNMPDGLTVPRSMPLFLHYINLSLTDKTVSVQVVPYSGANMATVIFNKHTILVKRGETVTLPITPSELGISAETRKFTVQVIDSATEVDLSAKRTYYVHPDLDLPKQVLAYINPFGCIETVAMYGRKSVQLPVTMSVVEIGKERKTVGNGTIEPLITYRSGAMPWALRECLVEMAVHNRLFEIFTTENKYVRLLLKAVKMPESVDNVGGIEIDAVPVFVDAPYSTAALTEAEARWFLINE